MNVATIPAGFPIEKRTTIGTRYANAGRTCIRSSTGRSVRCTDGHTADAIPSGMPTIVESTIATVISASVVIALGHICETPFTPPFGICRIPNEEIISAEKSAVRHEPTTNATTTATASTPTQVIQWRTLTTSFVAELSRLPKPPTTWCRKKFELSLLVTQLSRSSNQRGTPSTQFDD